MSCRNFDRRALYHTASLWRVPPWRQRQRQWSYGRRAGRVLALDAARGRSASVAGTSGVSSSCLLQGVQFGCWSRFAGSSAMPYSVVGRFSRSALIGMCWRRGGGEPLSSTTFVHHLGLALGGRPGASLARRLMLPVSNDTLLRVVRRHGSPRFVPPTVIGSDDWASRRNQRYGIICDLERRRAIALLPDREPATAQAWLSDQRQIEVVARDRGGGDALAAAKTLPQATQVADRWHLMENASHAFLDAVRKSMRQIRGAIGAATINPDLPHPRRADPI